MISTNNISLRFGKRTLFEEVNLKFTPGNCYGIIGANGSGKSTFIKILSGEIEQSSGNIIVTPGKRITTLKQNQFEYDEYQVVKTVIMGHEKLYSLIEERDTLYAKAEFSEEDGMRASELEGDFAAMNGWEAESEASELLSGLGIYDDNHTKLMKELTANEKVKVLLAQALFGNPDILLLDEPTNHLDLEATIWLESFLSNWKGGMVIISHDRTFLDRSVNHILEINLKKIILYHGNYSEYKINKSLRMEQHRAAYLNQQKQIKDTKRFIERFRYKNTKATQVQSRIKMLAKMEKIELLSEQNHAMNLILPQPSRPPQNIAICHNVNKNYGEIEVFNKLNLTVERGQKIGLVGHNGAGKSTLLKMLAGVEKVTDGAVRIGANVDKAYYAQHQLEILDPNDTVFESIRKSNEEWSENEIRSYLGSFLFSGDEIEKRIKILSGGEKARVSLAKMLIKPAHLLLLDEPTNHLDIISRNLVEKSLVQFTGSIVCISHDRHFLNNVTNLICEVGGRNIRMFEGNYDYYEWKKSNELSKENITEINPKFPSKNKLNYQERKKYNNRLAWIKKRFNIIENEMNKEKSTIQNPKYVDNYEILQKAMGNLTAFEDEYIKLMEEQDKIKANGI